MRRVIVTGGSSGIGRGTVEYFLSAGDLVLNIDIDHRESPKKGETQVIIDLAEVEEVEEKLIAAISEFGAPDIVVNSAGISRMDFTIESKLSDWQDTFNINVFGTFLVSKVAANSMIRGKKGGRIINISSQAGKNGYFGLGGYCASKHAVIGLTKTMAKELAPQNILVNAVCPGIVETPMKHRERVEGGLLRGMSPEEIYQEDCSQVPLGRTAEVNEIVSVIAFLSSEASSYMTGQALNITGGMTMH